MRVMLIGNPNSGKSTVFSRLTGIEVACSNYPGTTVTYCTGWMGEAGGRTELVDAPGTYSLKPQSPAEKVAVEMLASADALVNVADATNLERSLRLTLAAIETGKPVIVALNMSDEARHLGITTDRSRLEELLGVPVVETSASSGEGLKELSERLGQARKADRGRPNESLFAEAAGIAAETQRTTDRRHTVMDRVEDATLKPLTGIPIALAVLTLTFYAIVNAGNAVIAGVIDPVFNGFWAPLVRGALEPAFPAGIVHDILLGRSPDPVEGLGLLTTGVYVPFAMILPFVILFYFTLSVLEDVGYLPRLATLTDSVMHRLGMHGSAIVPAVLGMGCRVPGVLATRMLESRKQRLIAATLLAVCIPCLAQNAVIFGLLASHGIRYVLIVYAALAATYALVGLALNRLLSGEGQEILLEIPPYRKPIMGQLIKKTWMRVRHFLTEAVPYIWLGVLAVNLTYVSGLMDVISGVFAPVMSGLFGLPSEASAALIVGFLRKDFAVGMLAPIAMTPEQLTVASTVLVTYAPCLATLTVLYRELGARDFGIAMAAMLAATLVTGTAMRLVLL